MSTRRGEGSIVLLQGTLDLLILRTLRLGPTHGHAIAKAIEQGSDDVLVIFADTPLIRPQTLMRMRAALAEGAAVVVVATGLYTVAGGLRAVIYTEVLQTVVLIAGSAVLVIIGSFFRGPGFNFVFPWNNGIFFDL